MFPAKVHATIEILSPVDKLLSLLKTPSPLLTPRPHHHPHSHPYSGLTPPSPPHPLAYTLILICFAIVHFYYPHILYRFFSLIVGIYYIFFSFLSFPFYSQEFHFFMKTTRQGLILITYKKTNDIPLKLEDDYQP